MGPILVDPHVFPPDFIRLSVILIGDEHPRESVDLSIRVSTRLYNEGVIDILVDPYTLMYRYCGGYHGV